MERVSARRDNVLRLWAYLLELLRARRARLELSLQLQQNFQVLADSCRRRHGRFTRRLLSLRRDKRKNYRLGLLCAIFC